MSSESKALDPALEKALSSWSNLVDKPIAMNMSDKIYQLQSRVSALERRIDVLGERLKSVMERL